MFPATYRLIHNPIADAKTSENMAAYSVTFTNLDQFHNSLVYHLNYCKNVVHNLWVCGKKPYISNPFPHRMSVNHITFIISLLNMLNFKTQTNDMNIRPDTCHYELQFFNHTNLYKPAE